MGVGGITEHRFWFFASAVLVVFSLQPAPPLFAECVGYTSPFQACMDDCATKRAGCKDTRYKCEEARKFCEYDCRGNGKGESGKISHRARNTIWANYPEMLDAIDLINAGNNRMVSYALYPSEGYYSPRGIPTSVRKVPREDRRTPQYWLLLKLVDVALNYVNYNSLADENGGEGIRPLPPNTGVWYFSRGLRIKTEKDNIGVANYYRYVDSWQAENEFDLLRALYMGASGDPGGAEAIIDGSYLKMPSVRRRLMQMMGGEGMPRGREAVYKLAYLYETLCPQCAPGTYAPDFQTEDRNLVELAAGALSKFNRHPYRVLYENLAGADCEFPIQLVRD